MHTVLRKSIRVQRYDFFKKYARGEGDYPWQLRQNDARPARIAYYGSGGSCLFAEIGADLVSPLQEHFAGRWVYAV